MIVIRVNLYEVFPLFGYVVLMEYSVYGTNRGASPALYALIGVYIELFHVGEVGLVRGRVYAINRANVNAFRGFYPYAWLCYYVCHNSPPFPNIIRWLFQPHNKEFMLCHFCGQNTENFPCGNCGSYNVLDKGFVRLVDFMGGDVAVVQAARVSFGQGLKTPERDKRLIEYLMEHGHGTPFEHSVFKFHVKCPIFVAREWFRHRIASYNEISQRYVEVKEEFYVPEKLRKQSSKNKQASEIEDFENEGEILEMIRKAYREAYSIYRELLERGVARELARIVLPLGTYTQFYWTVNSRSLMNFLKLRMSEDAQYEIREYARVIYLIFREKMPWTAEAWEKFGRKNP
jgi:thymidylate synthase (FAD)